MGRYIGRVKVGKVSPRKGAELAIIRLPVKLKDKAGKYAYIFEENENEIRIVFSDKEDLDITSVQQKASGNIEERLKRLENIVESIVGGKYYMQNGGYQLTSASSLVVGQRLSEPLTRVRIPARASFL